METYKRVFVIVLDSLGIGAMPDSEKFGDKGVDTFGHILDKMGTLDIPNLQKLGMLNLHKGGTMEGVENPIGRYMRIGETSNGKDTMTGHWEMMGIYTQKPFITFTETGFPKELIDELEKRCGKRVIGNKSASGTEIIEELGEEEINTGAMIVYTSADSVMQICGNEETFDLANLYRCCEIARELTLKDNWIWAGDEQAISLAALAEESYYSLTNSSVLTAEVSEQVKKNTIATGCCFAEVEVDIKLGKIKILHIINVHDSGKLLNPQLAEMQVHGGMSMGMGYGISEQLILDEKTGRPLNGNLLDYKLMTMLDTPDIKADFVELCDPMGPYGNKALGEPPAIPCAPAIRNAVLHATGVAFYENPLTPQRLIDGFQKAGLI